MTDARTVKSIADLAGVGIAIVTDFVPPPKPRQKRNRKPLDDSEHVAAVVAYRLVHPNVPVGTAVRSYFESIDPSEHDPRTMQSEEAFVRRVSKKVRDLSE